MPYRSIRLETRDGFAVLSPTRQGTGIDAEFLRDLENACAAIDDDSGIHAVVLVLPPATANDAQGSSVRLSFIESMARPVICAIEGEAAGTALELALACDIRACSETARFAVGASALPGGGMTQRLPRLVGRGEALCFLLLGETIDAAEALRIGLVSAVHPQKRLREEAEALAARMAERGPIAVRYAKEAVRAGLELPLDQALRFETDLTVILQTTADRAEGVRAFIEKRPARFEGR
jgi:enoyl-CoA hydratase/carnithine racemase